MNYEFLEQSVQYAFKNDAKYGEKLKKRIYNNVKEDAKAENVAAVGEALAQLQGDEITSSVIIIKKTIGGNN